VQNSARKVHANMDRPGRGSRNEGHGRKIKGCTGKGVEIFREIINTLPLAE
jgi:hypothetical protein